MCHQANSVQKVWKVSHIMASYWSQWDVAWGCHHRRFIIPGSFLMITDWMRYHMTPPAAMAFRRIHIIWWGHLWCIGRKSDSGMEILERSSSLVRFLCCMMTSSNGNIFPRYWPRVPGIHRFPAQRPVTLRFDGFFDLGLNKRLSKHLWGCWFETLSRPLWRQCNGIHRAVTVPTFLYQ